MASDSMACFSSKVEYQGKTGKEIHGELADVCGSYLMLRFNSVQGNSNAVERFLKMKPGLDAYWMPPTKKCVLKFRIWYTLLGEFRW